MSVAGRSLSYRKSKKMTKERQRPTLGVPLIEAPLLKKELKLPSGRTKKCMVYKVKKAFV